MLDFLDNDSPIHSILCFYLPLIFSILSLLSCLLFLFTYLKYEKLRINSGRIIFLLIFCIMFFTVHLLASLFYSVERSEANTGEIYTSPLWCTVLGIITNLFIYNFLILNLCLCHNLLCCILYKESTFNKRYRIYLALSLFISVIITIILGIFKEIGYGPLGFCWLRNEKVSQIIHIITVSVVFPLAIGILIYVYSKEHFINVHSLYYYNEENFTQNNRKLFIRMNLSYIFVFSLTWLPSSVIYILDFIFKRNHWNIDAFWFAIVRAIALEFLCFSAFCMFLVRIQEPIVRKAFRKLIFQSKNEEKDGKEQRNSDSAKEKEENLAENLIKQQENEKEAKFKISKHIQPQQYETLILKKKSSSGDIFSFLKKKKSNLSEKEKAESRFLLIKVFFGSIFLIRNDINNQMVAINAKTPWEDHYYNELTNLKSKLGDLIRLLMKNDNESMDKMTEIFEGQLLEDMSCTSVASLVFANIKSLYNIDNIKLFDSFFPIENMKNLENLDYDPFSLKEEISINSFISFNNRFFLKILSESRINFLKDFFLKNLHDHYVKTKANSFLAPLICLYGFSFVNESYNIAIYENLIGKIPINDLYALVILDGLNIIHKKFLNGAMISTESFVLNDYEMENVLKLRYRDKSLLMRVMKGDLKFLLAKEATNYQIHLIFSRNPMKNPGSSIDNSVNNPCDDMGNLKVNMKKIGLVFECFIEDYECRVAIHNFLNTKTNLQRKLMNSDGSFENLNSKNGTEIYGESRGGLRKINAGMNENFSQMNPDVYAKNMMDALQDLL